MDEIYNHLGEELHWSRDEKAGLVLRAGDEPAQFAVMIAKGAYASIAEGRCGEGSWKFSRSGFLKNNIAITDTAEKEIGAFKKKGSGGFLEIDEGKKYEVIRNGLMTQYGLFFEKQLLVRCQLIQNQLKVYLIPEAKDFAELPLLVLFLTYLMIMQRIETNFSLPY